MAAVPDLILDNILARLPAKSLLRCRCVSKHWNRLITDPYFMKSRSRRMIFITDFNHVNLIDDNDPTHSMLKICHPCESLWSIYNDEVRVIGTINGIVLLQYYYGGVHRKSPLDSVGDLMLCNPFTRKYKRIPSAYSNRHCVRPKHHTRPICLGDYGFPHDTIYAYGFGYGNATPDDLKIVRFKEFNENCRNNDCGGGVCEIFSLKTFTWSKPREMNIKHIRFEETVGLFLNGFLYWVPCKMNKLIVLDVATIQLSEIHLPFERSYNSYQGFECSHLGTIHGSLCLLNWSDNNIDFNLWVMNGENSWSKRCSFTLPREVDHNMYDDYVICILDNGRILTGDLEEIHIYDTSDDSYTLTDVSISRSVFSHAKNGIEYVESLVSLSDVCSLHYKKHNQ